MDTNKREELKLRRLKLQEEVRLDQLRDKIRPQLTHLDHLQESYSINYDGQTITWIYENIPIRKLDGYKGIHEDFQVDVNDQTAKQTWVLQQEEIDTEAFASMCKQLLPAQSKLNVCYLGGSPELEINLSAFLKQPSIYLSSPETWIVTNDKKWIIEQIWEQNCIRIIEVENGVPILVSLIHFR